MEGVYLFSNRRKKTHTHTQRMEGVYLFSKRRGEKKNHREEKKMQRREGAY